MGTHRAHTIITLLGLLACVCPGSGFCCLRSVEAYETTVARVMHLLDREEGQRPWLIGKSSRRLPSRWKEEPRQTPPDLLTSLKACVKVCVATVSDDIGDPTSKKWSEKMAEERELVWLTRSMYAIFLVALAFALALAATHSSAAVGRGIGFCSAQELSL